MRIFKLTLLFLFVIFTSYIYAHEFNKVASKDPVLIMQGDEKHWCPVCGMSIKNYYKTSHGVYLKDGSAKQYCSIRCLAVDYPNIKNKINKIVVVDANTEKLIPAKTAFYLIGSSIPGTMTKVSKLAFANKSDAKKFKNMYGGNISDFDTAFKMAQDSLKTDIEMTQKKKESEIYPMGEKLFKDKCIPDIEPSRYDKINELKADIVKNKLCEPVAEKQLQAIALYLWEVKRVSTLKSNNQFIDVPKDAKCPVCGMFVYRYPKWAAEITYDKGFKLYFDGAKDMFKFIFNPSKWNKKYSDIKINQIRVTDYYSQKAIDGKSAYYVVGSDIYGPMGKELIPFEKESDAKQFLTDHKGLKIYKFNEITDKLVYDLDK
ncbi:MAG: nitrous oxide reductase accessory protein NosL [Deferribacterales bacterium]